MNAYIEQTAHDLSCYIMAGENVEGLSIRQEKTLALEYGNIRAAIIGESHFVVFAIFGEIFTELVACVERDPNLVQCYYSGKLSNPLNYKFSQANYHLQQTIDQWEKGMNALYGIKILAETSNGSSRIGLIENFPKAADNPRKPCTILAVEANTESVRVNSIHTYPTDNDGRGKIVQTMSCLEKKL